MPISALEVQALQNYVRDPEQAKTLHEVLSAFADFTNGIEAHDVQGLTGLSPERSEKIFTVASAVGAVIWNPET